MIVIISIVIVILFYYYYYHYYYYYYSCVHYLTVRYLSRGAPRNKAPTEKVHNPRNSLAPRARPFLSGNVCASGLEPSEANRGRVVQMNPRSLGQLTVTIVRSLSPAFNVSV